MGRLVRLFQWAGLGIVALLLISSAARAANAGDGSHGSKTEARAVQVENLIGDLLASNLAIPEYTDHGGGLHSMSISLDPKQREMLSSLFHEGTGDKAIAYYFLAWGQSLTPPSNASALIHAAISNAQLGYNYWVAVLNLGTDVTRNTTFKLTGPGRTFSRTFPLLYRANTIWFYWVSAAPVGTPGFYHFTSSVAGAGGAATIHTAAVNP